MDAIANECSLALARSLNIPIVAYWGFSFHGGEVMYTSVFNPPSIIPGFFSGFSQKMNLWQRIANFVLNIGHRLFMMDQAIDFQTFKFDKKINATLFLFQAKTAEKYIRQSFPDEAPVSKMVHDIDLFLVR